MNNNNKEKCPCCGYETLTEQASYEICTLCGWEDDGQDDSNANDVLGGPNKDYSLKEARENFKRFKSMYREIDKLFPSNPEFISLVLQFIDLFEKYKTCDITTKIDNEITLLEKKLLVTPRSRPKIPS